MRLPPQISFRNMKRSEAVEREIVERVEKLDRFYGRLEVGDPVRFHEETGDEGPQASTVHVERKARKAG